MTAFVSALPTGLVASRTFSGKPLALTSVSHRPVSTFVTSPFPCTLPVHSPVSHPVRMQDVVGSDTYDDDVAPAPIEDVAPELEEAKLFVGNLSWNTTDSSLGAAFQEHGNVLDARVIFDKFTGKSRGFGFIEYEDPNAAAKALEIMDGYLVDGRPVRVNRANKRDNSRRGSRGPPPMD